MNRRRAWSIVGGLFRLAIIAGALAVFVWYCVRQASAQPTPIIAEGGVNCLSRTDACVHEQTARPFSGESYGDVHGHCPPNEPGMRHRQGGGASPCHDPQMWIQSSGAMRAGVGLHWNPDGTLHEAAAFITRLPRVGLPLEGVMAGLWHGGADITYAEFAAGEPVVAVLRWETVNDWILLDAPEFTSMDDFQEVYGLNPWDAAIEFTVTCTAIYSPPVFDFEPLGARLRIEARIIPDPMRADFDRDGACATDDVFRFLAAWCGAGPRGDWDADGQCAVPDIFAFLSDWFAGE